MRVYGGFRIGRLVWSIGDYHNQSATVAVSSDGVAAALDFWAKISKHGGSDSPMWSELYASQMPAVCIQPIFAQRPSLTGVADDGVHALGAYVCVREKLGSWP